MSQVILLSIRSEYAEAIYLGLKRFEFRKNRVSIQTGDTAIIYETRPTSLLTGQFSIGKVFYGTTDKLIKLEAKMTARQFARKYLTDVEFASALEILRPIRWENGIRLGDKFPRVRPPQSYLFVREY